MKMIPTSFKTVRDAPEVSNCPNCFTEQIKIWETNRAALDCCADACSLLSVHVGVYLCSSCGKYFRNQPDFLRPSSTYTNRVVNVAIASVIEDGMPISRVPHRLSRDFGIRPSETTIRNWLGEAGSELVASDFVAGSIVDSFSGILCVDEAYSGSIAIIIATDPQNSDSLVGFLVKEKSFDSSDVAAFLRKLKEAGIEPDQLVTDESALYPAVVKDVWPNVAHQLCLFHINKKLSDAAKKAVRALRNKLPKNPKNERLKRVSKEEQIARVFALHEKGNGLRSISKEVGVSRNTIKKWLSSPSFINKRYSLSMKDIRELGLSLQNQPISKTKNIELSSGWESWDQVTKVSKALTKLSYGVSSRTKFGEERWQEYYMEVLGSPLGPNLAPIRTFIEEWHSIWWTSEKDRQSDARVAKEKWQKLASSDLDENCKPLKRFHSRMTGELFESLSTYFLDERFENTNNSAERIARKFKKIQKVRYSLRTKKSIKIMLSLTDTVHKRPIENNKLKLRNLLKLQNNDA